MNRMTLTRFSLNHPILIVILVVVMTVLLGAQFPKVTFDNDPENMLSENEYVRVFHKETKQRFGLYDFVIVGIVNDTQPNGVFNPGTLKRIDQLTKELTSLQRGPNGRPAVFLPADGDWPQQMVQPDLRPVSKWEQLLALAFSQDHERLFDEEGNSCIIASELISPSVVDNIRQAESGQLAIEYLMETVPQTDEEALRLRDDAMNNPLYNGTLVAEDGKAMALYIPLKAKTYSYNVAKLVEKLTADWPAEDQVYITGQPVAQDTFGVEMLVQMATSAPMAALVIFILLYIFFRRISLIIAPMLLAMVSVVATMGLLIGMGFNVHIMSSMIAIFLMPIAVSDSVHMLSEFYDTYARFRDKKKTIQHVISHLFQPMLFTSLTTIAGFASLATTPIPPVQVFGSFVAFGVALAWILTMTFIPAYVLLFVSTKSLNRIPLHPEGKQLHHSRLTQFMEWLGSFSYMNYRIILALTVLIIGVSVAGVMRIHVNDNPVKWFTMSHRIRVADQVLNSHFGGTYTAYLTLDEEHVDLPTCHERAEAIRSAVQERFASVFPKATALFVAALDDQEARSANAQASLQQCFVDLTQIARQLDEQTSASWNHLADAIIDMDPDSVNIDTLTARIQEAPEVDEADATMLLSQLKELSDLDGADLQDAALEKCDGFTSLSFEDFVYDMDAELTAPLFKRPEMLTYVVRLQEHLKKNPVVGKTSAVADAVKKAYYELNYVAPDGTEQEAVLEKLNERNAGFYSIPPTAAANGQVYTQLEGMKKKDSLFHLVTRDYQQANIWVQLKSGDNRDMEAVLTDVEAWMVANPAPVPLRFRWAGLTYLNVEWQQKMVDGMLKSLLSSFVVVLVMMMMLFRSPLMGLLSMIPLTVTILFIYGLIGWVGKDYDMPVAILSALTLGLSVDFAIHFLQRAREEFKRAGCWSQAVKQMFKEPAMAISRNAIVISVGFTPLLFAPLVPYRTVGFFMATIMAVSWISTLFVLAAGITALERFLFKKESERELI
ncbi:MAG: RND transporter [Spartobacteria bacterium]|nr:RND transporter [Spartobacteria bacterium]